MPSSERLCQHCTGLGRTSCLAQEALARQRRMFEAITVLEQDQRKPDTASKAQQIYDVFVESLLFTAQTKWGCKEVSRESQT